MAVNAEAFTEYSALQASETGSGHSENEKVPYPIAYHPKFRQEPNNLFPESEFIRLRNQQLSEEEKIRTPEQQLEDLNPEKGSKRWALVEIINNHTNFLDKFGRTRDLLARNFARFKVAAHELGHARVVNYLGGRVEEISIEPNGPVKGFTRYSLPSVRNMIDYISYRIACAAGSRLTEEKIGEHDHRGCTGDNGQIARLATIGEQITRGYYKASHFISEGWKIASRAVSGYSKEQLHSDSMRHLHIQPASEYKKAA